MERSSGRTEPSCEGRSAKVESWTTAMLRKGSSAGLLMSCWTRCGRRCEKRATRSDGRQLDCELRDHGAWGVEVQVYREREFLYGRRWAKRSSEQHETEQGSVHPDGPARRDPSANPSVPAQHMSVTHSMKKLALMLTRSGRAPGLSR
jgi:hypothetical protein